ncbi:2,3-diaminopropionate biosynthesis protein SbnA [Streptomyces sp. W16]|uniref:2,3-diaminopropionate biosynthesis protein SbnA n=1 Tax=Streptomyces sp. W16 TaxID=3076631 RepID=UPI00295B0925|nr:2,3-diaminopropionate biosynthesis protein SbnA [Streptomyces sp. W16]MDV9178666.1 2,3-diaminopropionate biosynthesis protein SbnA [Streptomyces sp. W16]
MFTRVQDIDVGGVFLELPGYAGQFETHLKLEALHPAGSIKIRTARELIESAETDGRLGLGSEVIESTSGNLGVALATICAAKGYRLTVVTDPNANTRSIAHMKALGTRVVVVRERDAGGGFLHTRIEYIARRLADDTKLVWLNQYANPANVRAHRRGTAAEILDGFGAPDWLFVGTGTSGTLMGCVEHLRGAGCPTAVVAVDAVGSVTFGARPGPRRIPGVGTSRRPEIFRDDGSFHKILVSEEDTIRVCRRVARDHGLLVGGSTGTVLAAVTALRDRIRPGSRVLAISPDLGDRYLDTIYDDTWVAENFGPHLLDHLTEGMPCTSSPYSPESTSSNSSTAASATSSTWSATPI